MCVYIYIYIYIYYTHDIHICIHTHIHTHAPPPHTAREVKGTAPEAGGLAGPWSGPLRGGQARC